MVSITAAPAGGNRVGGGSRPTRLVEGTFVLLGMAATGCGGVTMIWRTGTEVEGDVDGSKVMVGAVEFTTDG